MKTSRFSTLFLLAPLLTLGCGGDDPVTPGTTSTSSSASGGGQGGEGGAGGQGGQGGEGGGQGGAGGQGGGMGGSGGGSSEIPIGDPIEAPPNQWTWVPFDNAFCGNGSPTGIGVNISDKSSRLVIFLTGGGACWNYPTCYQLKIAANLDGYDETKFQGDAGGTLSGSLFDRTDPDNPMKDDSYVFVPYCTGDVHSGDKIADYNGVATHHVGFKNITAFMSRILPTFPNVDRVLLAGSSAGGFGVGTNFWRIQKAFGSVRVDVINDSGPALPSPYLSEMREKEWRDAWNLNAALPPDCPECLTDLDTLFTYYAKTFPNNRAALLSYTKDNVISLFYGPIQTTYFEEGLKALTMTRLEGIPNFRYYYLPGENHVLLSNPKNVSADGVVLKTWLKQMVEDDPTWANVSPF